MDEITISFIIFFFWIMIEDTSSNTKKKCFHSFSRLFSSFKFVSISFLSFPLSVLRSYFSFIALRLSAFLFFFFFANHRHPSNTVSIIHIDFHFSFFFFFCYICFQSRSIVMHHLVYFLIHLE